MIAFVALLVVALPPRPAGCVLDEARALDAAGTAKVEALCAALGAHGADAAVLVTGDLRGEEPDTLADAVFDAWALGHEDRDDGLLVLVRASPAAQRGVWVSDGDDVDAALPSGELDGRAAAGAARLGKGDIAGAIASVLGGLVVPRAASGAEPETGPFVSGAPPEPADEHLALELVLAAGGGYLALLAAFALATGLSRALVPRSRDAVVRWLAPRGFVRAAGVALAVAALLATAVTLSWTALAAAAGLVAVEGALALRLLRVCPRCFGRLAGACAACGYAA